MIDLPEPPKNVAAALDAAPVESQDGLRALRRLVLETARNYPEIGRVEECLKWGQPAFTTPETKSGSTLRIGCPKTGGFAIYAHCQSGIISAFADMFPGMDTIEGNRAVHFQSVSDIDADRHVHLIAHALRYHLLK